MKLTLILFSVGAALAFLALGIGANAVVKTKHKTPLDATQFAALMALVGFGCYYLGVGVSHWLAGLEVIRYLTAGLIMALLFVKTLLNHRAYKSDDNYYNIQSHPVKFLLSLAAGINALLCAISLTITGFDHLKSALLTAAFIFVGAMVGAGLSPKTAQKVLKCRPAIIGSLFFLAVSAFFILKHFGIISLYS